MEDGAQSAEWAEFTVAERAVLHAIARGETAVLGGQAIGAGFFRNLVLGRIHGFALPHAGLKLRSAIISGGLDFQGATISVPIILDDVRIDGRLDTNPKNDFDAGADADGTNVRCAIMLDDCSLRGLALHEAEVIGHVSVKRARIGTDLDIRGGRIDGCLALEDGVIGGGLTIAGVEIGDSERTVALAGAGLQVDGSVRLSGIDCKGAADFSRCRFRRGVSADRFTVLSVNDALLFESSWFGGDVVLAGVKLSGNCIFTNANVAGTLNVSGMVVEAATGGFLAAGVRSGHSISMEDASIRGAVIFDRAVVRHHLTTCSAHLNGGRVALSVIGAQIGGDLDLSMAHLAGRADCAGAGIAGRLVLSEARINGGDQAVNADGATFGLGVNFHRAMVSGLVSLEGCRINGAADFSGATLKTDAGAVCVREFGGGLASHVSGGQVF
ncbi:MAG TPA: hypothetical protein VMX97_11720 [Hyphomicrobiaceae bacterium]|nr:hypothetical protein [Hyphomicrobiaceae bacterium]